MPNLVDVARGDSPIILAFPHTGTHIPRHIWDRLNENGRLLADSDWHVDTLYAGLLPNATTVRATFHRYVIDANRDPSGESLYPGQNTTGLIPATDFDGEAIWRTDHEPTPADVADRLAEFHGPYHAVLQAEIERVREIHGIAVLYDCHSIRSRIPFLFEGRLPDLNIGTYGGTTCDRALEGAVARAAGRAAGFTHVLNGRFKGGWTTRRYGKPDSGVHALQMELAQNTHLVSETPPFVYDTNKAALLRPHLKTILAGIEAISLELRPIGR